MNHYLCTKNYYAPYNYDAQRIINSNELLIKSIIAQLLLGLGRQ